MVIEAKKIKIVYMGTPDFAVAPLKMLHDNGYNVVAVITVPDKPAGRGQKLQQSAVKQYAESVGLPVLQPVKLKDDNFISELKSYNADLFIVVAFRMLPEIVWSMPALGTFNLHASLLPQYRGAAPINWAIINGETKTGVTTFFIDKEIDTGRIIFSREIEIAHSDNAEIVHDKLMSLGATLVAETVDAIASNSIETKIQSAQCELKPAPKIFKNDCRIDWLKPAENIYNFIRGLSPYPAAWCEFACNDEENVTAKIFSATTENSNHNLPVGTIVTDEKTFLKVACNGGFISVENIQLAGKKRLPIKEFLAGFRNINKYKIE